MLERAGQSQIKPPTELLVYVLILLLPLLLVIFRVGLGLGFRLSGFGFRCFKIRV